MGAGHSCPRLQLGCFMKYAKLHYLLSQLLVLHILFLKDSLHLLDHSRQLIDLPTLSGIVSFFLEKANLWWSKAFRSSGYHVLIQWVYTSFFTYNATLLMHGSHRHEVGLTWSLTVRSFLLMEERKKTESNARKMNTKVLREKTPTRRKITMKGEIFH